MAADAYAVKTRERVAPTQVPDAEVDAVKKAAGANQRQPRHGSLNQKNGVVGGFPSWGPDMGDHISLGPY